MKAVSSLLLAAALCAVPAATAGSAASPASVQAALAADGYKVVDKAEYNSAWGVVAESINVTLYTTKAAKRVYYVSGNAADRGYDTQVHCTCSFHRLALRTAGMFSGS